MSITDELRTWVTGANPAVVDGCSISVGTMTYGCKKALLAIADRIDAEHERAVMSAMNDALYHANDESMAELGWVRLPKDADGVPFRIGDKVDSDHYEDGTVTGIQFYKIYNGGIRTLIAVRPDGWDVATWRTPDEYRHHHDPTVEDVLRGFFSRYVTTKPKEEDDAIIAEYAAKLRLAGEGE